MNAVLEVRSDLKEQLEDLSDEIHRSETDLVNEALSLYLAHQRKIIGQIQEGLAQAQRGEFVPDDEMELFFARYGKPEA